MAKFDADPPTSVPEASDLELEPDELDLEMDVEETTVSDVPGAWNPGHVLAAMTPEFPADEIPAKATPSWGPAVEIETSPEIEASPEIETAPASMDGDLPEPAQVGARIPGLRMPRTASFPQTAVFFRPSSRSASVGEAFIPPETQRPALQDPAHHTEARPGSLRLPLPDLEPTVSLGNTSEPPVLPPGFSETSSGPQQSTPSAPVQAETDGEARYQHRSTLGSGGFGLVVEAFDQRLERTVAIKLARSDKVFSTPEEARSWGERAEAALAFEARLAGRIEDPRVVPIHDLGRTATGEIYVVMKRVRGTSLGTLLTRLAGGDAELQRELTFTRRLSTFVQVCLGMAFVHDQGVVHRDLKPANIMVGEYGEIQIIDWGLARYLGSDADSPALPELLRERDRHVIQGTPGYMAPEQALGDHEAIDTRTDIYALGAILYEMLTFRPPIDGDESSTPLSLQLMRIALGRFPPPSRRVPGLFVPEELDAICLKALAVEKDARFPDARSLARAIEGYLEGTRRKEEAECLAARGLQLSEEYRALFGALHDARRAVQTAAERTARWASPEEKSLLWALEDNIAEIERRRVFTFAEAVRAFHEALGYDRESVVSRAGLVDIYWARFEEAERGHQREAMIYYERLVRQYDNGALAGKLEGNGRLEMTSDPIGLDAWLFTYKEEQRRLVTGDGRRIGRTPLEVDPLPMGRYLLVLHRPGFPEVRYPVWIRRQQTWIGHLELDRTLLGYEWVFVAAGPCILGGDPEAPGHLERTEIDLPGFAVGRFPVNCGAWCDYLNELTEEEAHHRVPRRLQGSQEQIPCWGRGHDGRYFVPRRDQIGERWDAEMAITCISWEDAMAYARWYSRVKKATFRLPSEMEWEKAARGVDGRLFPWGDHFDPSFCKMAESRPGMSQPEVIGTFPVDESPYGVRDMAGGMSEWVNGFFDDQNLLMTVKGGGWNSSAERCRPAARAGSPPRVPTPGVTFRLVRVL